MKILQVGLFSFALLHVLTNLQCLPFKPEFKQRLATLQPIEIQPMKEVVQESSATRQSFLPVLEKDGGPITLTLEQLEALNSQYLTNALKEMDKPEVIQVAVDREIFVMLLAVSDAYPETPTTIPSVENLEKFLYAAEFMGTPVELILTILKKFLPKDLCKLYQMNTDSPVIVQAVKMALQDYYPWKNIRTIPTPTKGSITDIAISRDNNFIIGSSTDRSIIIWNLNSGEIKCTLGSSSLYTFNINPLIGHTKLVKSVNISPDGKYINSGSDDRTIRIWDLETCRLLRTLGSYTNTNPNLGHLEGVTSVISSPDGNYIISGSSDFTIKIWNLRTNQITTLGVPYNRDPDLGHTWRIDSVAVSPDGKYIVSSSADSTPVNIWDFATGELLYTFDTIESRDPSLENSTYIYSLTFSPDGRYIIGASSDHTIKIWDFMTGQLRVLGIVENGDSKLGHTDMIKSLAVSADGNYIISGSLDNTIRIWNFTTGQLIHTLGNTDRKAPKIGHTNTVEAVALSVDGKYIISASYDDTIRIWQQESVENFCALKHPIGDSA